MPIGAFTDKALAAGARAVVDARLIPRRLSLAVMG